MKIQAEAEEAGYRDYVSGVKKVRNPYQYTSDIFKQAAWITGWNKAEKERNK